MAWGVNVRDEAAEPRLLDCIPAYAAGLPLEYGQAAIRCGEQMSERRLVGSGSRFEPEIGFSRAVRAGAHIAVAGTAPVSGAGGTATPGDVYGQTKRCLEIIDAAITEAGGTLEDVVRTRVMLVDITTWREAARAHGEYFGAIRPVCTFVEVSRFIDPQWLVEIEADAIVLAR